MLISSLLTLLLVLSLFLFAVSTGPMQSNMIDVASSGFAALYLAISAPVLIIYSVTYLLIKTQTFAIVFGILFVLAIVLGVLTSTFIALIHNSWIFILNNLVLATGFYTITYLLGKFFTPAIAQEQH
ncbi:hypothetical protein [Geomicrobium sp. JCM 19039]|uniref:hypothetical protein n=1 Tax=Geomicrobium sp. JCM 19039 TaxID=1460636 RepID=UPI0005A8394B|nr:hypothetical protein [Geomicrobium sp. JCM 19039]